MSGFTGYLTRNNSVASDVISKMGARIKHRGDQSYQFQEQDVALWQVTYNNWFEESTDGLHLLFDGRLNNRQALENRLQGDVTELSDYALILEAYRQLGRDMMSDLFGNYAFVIYNEADQSVFGARDIFGAKPFYIHAAKGSFLFSSEIKSFLDFPDFKPQVNKNALKQYLVFQYVPTTETMFEGVFKVEPGTYFFFEDGKMEVQRYRQFSFEEDKGRSYDDTVNAIYKEVSTAVANHVETTPEFGAYLSGGVDSSFVASTIGKDFVSYSVGFGIEGFDERSDAKALSDILGIENKNVTVSAADFFGEMPKIQYYSDEPHANLSAVPLFFLSRLARQNGDKIVLGGEGADELFGGYESFVLRGPAKQYLRLPKGIRSGIRHLANALPYFKGQGFLEQYGHDLEEYYIGESKIMEDHEANHLLAPTYQSPVGHAELLAPYYEDVKNADMLQKKMYIDFNIWMPNDIFLKGDKMSMAHGVQVQTPLLDENVYRLSRTLGYDEMIDGDLTKKAFREASLKSLPTEWAKRPKKGFPVPVRHWLREDTYYNHVKEVFQRDYVSEFFNVERLLTLLEDHYTEKENNQRKIYTIYTFLVWYQVYFLEQ